MEKIISFLFFCFLAFFPFGQLTRLPLKISQVNVYLTDVFLGLLLVCSAAWLFFKKKKFKAPPLAKPIFLFLLLALVSLTVNGPLLAGREAVVAGLYWLRLAFYFSLYFLISWLQKKFNFLNSQFLLNCLLIIGVATAVFGLIQYFLWPEMAALEAFGWDPHYYRVVGTFLDPGYTGIILVLTLILVVVLKKNFAFYSLFAIVYFALALTYSRSSYLAYLTAMGVVAFFKNQAKFFLMVLFLAALTLLILPRKPGGEGVKLERTSTIKARIENWQRTLTIAKDHPFLGVGFNTYRYVQRDYGFLDEKWPVTHAGAGADSSFLFVLATTGIFGLAAYTFFWWKAITFAQKRRRKILKIIVLASAAALLVHACFLNSLFYPWVLAWLAIILAL